MSCGIEGGKERTHLQGEEENQNFRENIKKEGKWLLTCISAMKEIEKGRSKHALFPRNTFETQHPVPEFMVLSCERCEQETKCFRGIT